MYLATQISLYLASAALIGIALGWLIWGRSGKKKLTEMHREMTSALEQERKLATAAQRDLEKADAKLKDAVEREQASSGKALTEIRQLLETEKKAAVEARSTIEQLRLDMEIAVNAEKAAAAETIHETMVQSEKLKQALHQARAKETQVRAELEELRLMAGAEKLAAQTARSEFERKKVELLTSLDAERKISGEAKRALDDIQATLARTFGGKAGLLSSLETASESFQPETMDLFKEKPSSSEEAGKTAPGKQEAEGFIEIFQSATSSEPINVAGAESLSGAAIQVEEDEKDTVTPAEASDDEDREAGTGDEPTDAEDQPPADVTVAEILPRKPVAEAEEIANKPVPLHAVPTPEDPHRQDDADERPLTFYDKQPHDVDSLQAIGGIDPSLENLLNDQGCYQFRQLAYATQDDIDWLARQIPDIPDLRERIARENWIQQAKQLQAKKRMTAATDRPRWWSRRRLR